MILLKVTRQMIKGMEANNFLISIEKGLELSFLSCVFFFENLLCQLMFFFMRHDCAGSCGDV